jgi:YidC/Oxa1 family membrane protein insertase
MDSPILKRVMLPLTIWLMLICSNMVSANNVGEAKIESDFYVVNFSSSGDISSVYLTEKKCESIDSCTTSNLYKKDKLREGMSLVFDSTSELIYTWQERLTDTEHEIVYSGYVGTDLVVSKKYVASNNQNIIDVEFSVRGDSVQNLRFHYPSLFTPDNGGLSGFALDYGAARPILLKNGDVVFLDDQSIEESGIEGESSLNQDSWFGIRDRFNFLLISPKENPLTVIQKSELGALQVRASTQSDTVNYELAFGKNAKAIEMTQISDFRGLQYASLWAPFKQISKLLSAFFHLIHQLVGNWGVAIVSLALALRLILTPVTKFTDKLNAEAMTKKELIAPSLIMLKENYKGEQLHNKILKLHKAHGISGVDPIKPLLGLFIQIPVFIAVFNMLGEESILNGVGFLWIENLALSDKFIMLSQPLPLVGYDVNLLPVLMLVISIVSAKIYASSLNDINLRRGQELKLFSMALIFFVLLYSFPAAMVLYWASVNCLQLLFQIVTHIRVRYS